MQSEKVEVLRPSTSNMVPTDVFRVLGLQFSLTQAQHQKGVSLEVSIPQAKVDTLQYLISVTLDQLQQGKVDLKDTQKLTGSLVAAIFFQRHSFSMARMQAFFIASDERRFPSVIRQAAFRKILKKALLDTSQALNERTPVKFQANGFKKGLILCYTDASLEYDDNGTAVGWLGGLFVFCDAQGAPSDSLRFAFSYKLVGTNLNIMELEGLAVLIALRRLPKGIKQNFRVACAIDNTSVLFGISKSFSPNVGVTAIVCLVLNEAGNDATFFYVPSSLNIADVLTREKRFAELPDPLFIEKIKTNISDLDNIFTLVNAQKDDIKDFFWRKTSPCKKRRRR